REGRVRQDDQIGLGHTVGVNFVLLRAAEAEQERQPAPVRRATENRNRRKATLAGHIRVLDSRGCLRGAQSSNGGTRRRAELAGSAFRPCGTGRLGCVLLIIVPPPPESTRPLPARRLVFIGQRE